jgi:lysophospholipase L1-like esterase
MRICFVGDSFVNGTGDPTYLGWTGRLCRDLRSEGHDITHYNLGVRRETSADIKDRWLREVTSRLTQQESNRLVFSFGANDTTLEGDRRRVSLEDSLKNTHEILQIAKRLCPVLMVSSPPIANADQNLRIADLSSQIRSICLELNVPHLDVFKPLQVSETWIQEAIENGGAHPRAGGYAELAKWVKELFSWKDWLG